MTYEKDAIVALRNVAMINGRNGIWACVQIDNIPSHQNQMYSPIPVCNCMAISVNNDKEWQYHL